MKNTLRNLLLASAGTLAFAAHANAEWTGSAGYSHFSLDAGPSDIDLGVLYATIGWRLELGDGLVLLPEARAGFGINDDSVGAGSNRVDIEVDSIFGGLTRLQYEFTGGAYVYAAPSYTRIALSASGPGTGSVSGNSWEFGLGAGVGYMFNPQLGGEFSYENIDGEDVFNFGLRYNFGR